MNRDERYMAMALALARKGEGNTSPNPMVGALLVKGGKILAKGYHRRFGYPHAEIEALDRAGKAAKGAVLYVTMEPCSSSGKTPPCTDRIIAEGIKEVIIGMPDPNPVNHKKGVNILQRNGIKVKSNVLREEAEDLNRAFTSYITKGRPYVTVKAAQSLDGKIASFTGHSKWITNRTSRSFVHQLRSRVDAVLVGINTVKNDDPLLNARVKSPGRQPLRIILDSRLSISEKSRVIKDRSARTLIATGRECRDGKANRLKKKNIDIAAFKDRSGRVCLGSLLRYLARRGVSHILVEGGGTVIADFLKKGFVDEMIVFMSPKIIGGRDAVTSVEGRGAAHVTGAVKLKDVTVRRFNEDIMVRGYVQRDN